MLHAIKPPTTYAVYIPLPGNNIFPGRSKRLFGHGFLGIKFVKEKERSGKQVNATEKTGNLAEKMPREVEGRRPRGTPRK